MVSFESSRKIPIARRRAIPRRPRIRPARFLLAPPATETHVQRLDEPAPPQTLPHGPAHRWPISAADPFAPRHNFPSRIMPPPTPVPNVTHTILRFPRAAPCHISPTAAAFASFSKNVERCNASLRALVKGNPSRHGRFGALTTMPSLTFTDPGTTIARARMLSPAFAPSV